MKKIANDKFDAILKERAIEKRQEKAKKEAIRQVNVERYYDEYHNLVTKEKERLTNVRNKSIKRTFLFTLVIFLIIFVCIEIYYFYPEILVIIQSFIFR